MAVFHVASSCRSVFKLKWGHTFSLWWSALCSLLKCQGIILCRDTGMRGKQLLRESSEQWKSSGLTAVVKCTGLVVYGWDVFTQILWICLMENNIKRSPIPSLESLAYSFFQLIIFAGFFLLFLSFYQDAAFYRCICFWVKNVFVNKFV